MMTKNKFIAVLLWQVADELEKQFGPHPHVPVEKIKEVAKGYVERFHLPDEGEILTALNAQIDVAFSRKAGGVG